MQSEIKSPKIPVSSCGSGSDIGSGSKSESDSKFEEELEISPVLWRDSEKGPIVVSIGFSLKIACLSYEAVDCCMCFLMAACVVLFS